MTDKEFAERIEMHFVEAVASARRHGAPDPEAAADDALLAAYRGYTPERGDFRAYLGVIVKRQAIRDFQRQRDLREVEALPEGVAAQEPAPEKPPPGEVVDPTALRLLNSAESILERFILARQISPEQGLNPGEPGNLLPISWAELAANFGLTPAALAMHKARLFERLGKTIKPD